MHLKQWLGARLAGGAQQTLTVTAAAAVVVVVNIVVMMDLGPPDPWASAQSSSQAQTPSQIFSGAPDCPFSSNRSKSVRGNLP